MLPRPAGVFSESYAADSAWVRTRGERILFILLVALPFGLPWLVGPGLIGALILIAVSMTSVLGLYITTGMAGQMNLGQAAFMGVGAYCTAIAAGHGVSFLPALLLGGLGAGAFGAVVGLPALRIKGYYLALSTIAAQFLFQVGVVRLPEAIFGGNAGLAVPPLTFWGMELTSSLALYFVALTVTLAMLYGAYNIYRSRVGRALIAVRDNEVAAGILGIDVVFYKTLAFTLGAFYGGVAGGLWAYYTRFVVADQFTLMQSIWYVGMLIVGGAGVALGAILGTVVIRALEQAITILGPSLAHLFPQLGSSGWFALMNVLLGSAIIGVLLLEPRGLAYRWNVLRAAYGIWPFPHQRS